MFQNASAEQVRWVKPSSSIGSYPIDRLVPPLLTMNRLAAIDSGPIRAVESTSGLGSRVLHTSFSVCSTPVANRHA